MDITGRVIQSMERAHLIQVWVLCSRERGARGNGVAITPIGIESSGWEQTVRGTHYGFKKRGSYQTDPNRKWR